MNTSELQEQFLKSIQDPKYNSETLFTPILNLNRKQCLEIYRKGYKARLTEALGSTYEACWWVLGDESYFKIAADYIALNPSHAYDLADYGESFPEFLSGHSESSEIPFIVELANFEWMFKDVFHSANLENKFDVSQVGEDSIIQLNPSVQIFKSDFAVYDIWKHRSQDIEVLGTVAWEEPTQYIAYRSEGKIFVKKLDADTHQFLRIFQAGASLSTAVDLTSNAFPEIAESRISEIFAQISGYLFKIG